MKCVFINFMKKHKIIVSETYQNVHFTLYFICSPTIYDLAKIILICNSQIMIELFYCYSCHLRH